MWSHPGTAQEPRRRPQDRAREAQDSPTRPPEVFRGAQTRQGGISKRFWSESGPPGTSKNLTKCCTVDDFRGFRHLARKASTEAQNAPKGAPREAQMSPRRAPGGPRSGPRAQEGSKRCLERAKRRPTQERPRRGPKEPQAAQTPPGSPSGAHFGLILGPPGLIFEPSRRPFRASRAAR